MYGSSSRGTRRHRATTDTKTGTAGETKPELAVVDCDIHPHMRNGIKDLEPYLSGAWQKRLGIGHAKRWAKEVYASEVSVPKNVLYANPVGVMRRDTVPEDGSVPCRDPAFVVRDRLDALGIDRAVLIGGQRPRSRRPSRRGSRRHHRRAYNDWLTEHGSRPTRATAARSSSLRRTRSWRLRRSSASAIGQASCRSTFR